MMVRRCVVYFLVAVLCSGAFSRSAAQPTLPDIAASTDKGVVVLSWNCQYSNIKLIAVMRSADSVSNFTTIGNVKNLEKGMQAFVDGHPLPGRNYYQLAIVFKSGLSWRSNHCRITLDKSVAVTSTTLPANDSLQKFTVTEERATVLKQGNKTAQAPMESKAAPHKIAVSFDQDMAPDIRKPAAADSVKIAPVKHKVVITLGEPETNLSVNIQSRFIKVDEVTGHIDITVPDDLNKVTYSLRFYDQQNTMALDIPRVKAMKTILDRRNFQHKGTYKFVLRKDGIELESGYIMLGAAH